MAKSKSRVVEDIDEAALLQSVYEQSNPPVVPLPPRESEKPVEQPPAPEPEKPKEVKEPVRQKRGNTDYGTLFLQRNELKARSCVYISQKVHGTISKIIQNISDRDITVGGYIDSILIEHLETHKDEIIELYNKELAKKKSNSLIDF
jgi:hypothetical protein